MRACNASGPTLNLLYNCMVVYEGWTYNVMAPGEAQSLQHAGKPQLIVQGIFGKSVSEETTLEGFRADVGSIVTKLLQEADRSGRDTPSLSDIMKELIGKKYWVSELSPAKTL